jgi:DegV family protein with EDD domain
MEKVIVVTDSSATVPRHLVERLDIRVVPIVLALDGRTFHDGVDITPGDLYRWLRSGGAPPTTASPSVGDFVQVFEKAAQDGSGIVSIHMSPNLSSTMSTALAASHLMKHVPIRVLDSHSAAMAQGFVVLEAARAAASGASLDDVVSRVAEVAPRVSLLATLGTLEYLHRGGRIGGLAALLGTMLQIKPVLYLADGQVDVFAKPRTQSRAIRSMLQRLEQVADSRPVHVAVLQADVQDEAEVLRQMIADRFDCAEIYVTELTPVMGAHTGPGLLGIAFFVE